MKDDMADKPQRVASYPMAQREPDFKRKVVPRNGLSEPVHVTNKSKEERLLIMKEMFSRHE